MPTFKSRTAKPVPTTAAIRRKFHDEAGVHDFLRLSLLEHLRLPCSIQQSAVRVTRGETAVAAEGRCSMWCSSIYEKNGAVCRALLVEHEAGDQRYRRTPYPNESILTKV